MGKKKKYNLANVEEKQEIKNPTEQKQENVLQEKQEDEKIEFKVFGYDDIVLSKIDFLDYQKISNKMMFLKYHLLGQFDDKGNYYIKNDIKKDLIKAQKEIQFEDEQGFVAHLRYAKLVFKFEVNITYSEDLAKAELVLVENIEEHTFKTIVDSYQAQNNENFRIDLRKRYNLVDVAFTIRDEEVPNLNIWLYWQSEEFLYWQYLYELGAQYFLLKAIAILEGYGAQGEQILKKYNDRIKEIKNINNENKFSELKEIFDDVVNSFGGYEKIDEGKGKFAELAKAFSKPFFQKEDTRTAIIEVSSEKKETKKDSKKEDGYSWKNIDKYFTIDTKKKSVNKTKKTKKSSTEKKQTYSFELSGDEKMKTSHNPTNLSGNNTGVEANNTGEVVDESVNKEIESVLSEDFEENVADSLQKESISNIEKLENSTNFKEEKDKENADQIQKENTILSQEM